MHTVETEASGDSWSTLEKGPFLVGTLGCRDSTRDFCAASAALVGPVQTFFSSPYNIKLYLSPSPSKLHGQAVLPRRLSLNMCL